MSMYKAHLVPLLAVASLLAWAGLASPALAAPSEGTAGQTVTGRSIYRHAAPARRADTVVAAAPSLTKPTWKDLTPAQQQALQPLAPHWDRLSEDRKRKWLVISKNFAKLPPEEQARVHRRMSKWVSLSQQQRAQARQNFNEIKNLSPEQKAAQWEAYQALSPEEKRSLANRAGGRPAGVATVKPATTSKLPSVPVRGAKALASPHMAEAILPIQRNTLLPRQEPVRPETERSPYEDEPAEAQ